MHVTSGVELLLSVKIIVPCKREGVEPPKTPLPLYLLSTFLSSLYDTRCVNYPSALQAVVLGPHKIAPYSPEAGRQLIFQTMNSVTSDNLSLKYQRFTP